MSNPICNEITIKCEKETFKKIAMILIDEEKGETTYNKFWNMPEGLDEMQAYEWREENYGCTKGIFADVDYEKQEIFFETDHTPAVKVVERIAQLFPKTRIEYGYDFFDQDFRYHDILDTYENGILIDRDDTIESDEDDEDED